MKEKSNSPRRREERGSSFHEVISSDLSSKGTGSSGISGCSNGSLLLENEDSASSGASLNFSNGHSHRHNSASSDIADEDDEDGDISLGKMKWFFEINEKQDADVQMSARGIPIVIEDI